MAECFGRYGSKLQTAAFISHGKRGSRHIQGDRGYARHPLGRSCHEVGTPPAGTQKVYLRIGGAGHSEIERERRAVAIWHIEG
jgi:hypothetical protein